MDYFLFILLTSLCIGAIVLVWNKSKVKFCKHCGKAVVERQYFLGYNSHTGEKIYGYWKVCPDNRDSMPVYNWIWCPPDFSWINDDE